MKQICVNMRQGLLLALFLFALTAFTTKINAQVTIGSREEPDQSAVLDIKGKAIDNLKLPRIITIASMKASGNDLTYVSDVLGTSGIRKLLFDSEYRDDLDCFDTATGEFSEPYTGLYQIETNLLLRSNN